MVLPHRSAPFAVLADGLTAKRQGRKAGLRFNPLERRFCPAKKAPRPSFAPSTHKKGRIATLSAVRHYTLEELQQKQEKASQRQAWLAENAKRAATRERALRKKIARQEEEENWRHKKN